MPELRMNVITGEWVIIAKERSKRPHDFASPCELKQGANCVFCYGNEDKTPEEVYAVRPEGSIPNKPGWLVRVVPNKFPAVTAEVEPAYAGKKTESGFPAVGIHEVVIDT
ncbi:MAG TPA: galactose-1-phosphate uridylyltransferase, partial [Desulfobacteria bacterium]|nr:galactose-1-phosphate uridylyltransferase [Desulfobacteria bacterium]